MNLQSWLVITGFALLALLILVLTVLYAPWWVTLTFLICIVAALAMVGGSGRLSPCSRRPDPEDGTPP
ncbi:hypothetical protein, partial [Trebonia sp.]|uniref:hypothetical protein n=1 Tax=Trebonia sp. TaxID=2767075 RepID=UPI0026365EA4